LDRSKWALRERQISFETSSKRYLLNRIAEPCSVETELALVDDFADPESPSEAAKGELSSALWAKPESVTGETVCEETVKVLDADSALAPLTMENTTGERSAVVTIE
jgi:hypothetical protein